MAKRKQLAKLQEEWGGENGETTNWNLIGFLVLSTHQQTENSHWLRTLVCQSVTVVLVTCQATHKGR